MLVGRLGKKSPWLEKKQSKLKMGKNLKQTLYKEAVLMANQHMETWSTLATREL